MGSNSQDAPCMAPAHSSMFCRTKTLSSLARAVMSRWKMQSSLKHFWRCCKSSVLWWVQLLHQAGVIATAATSDSYHGAVWLHVPILWHASLPGLYAVQAYNHLFGMLSDVFRVVLLCVLCSCYLTTLCQNPQADATNHLCLDAWRMYAAHDLMASFVLDWCNRTCNKRIKVSPFKHGTGAFV